MNSASEKLGKMLKRQVSLCGVTPVTDDKGKVRLENLDTAVRTFFSDLQKEEPDQQKQADMILNAWEGANNARNSGQNPMNAPAMRALCAARTELVQNYIYRESLFRAAFFEGRPLGLSEVPWVYQTTQTQEVGISYVGEDGNPVTVRTQKPEHLIPVALRMVTSNWVEYPTMDIYKGRVDEAAKATLQIAFDLSFQISKDCYTLLTATPQNGGCFGAFSYEQGNADPSQRIYVAHSGIDSTNLPTTNDFVNQQFSAGALTDSCVQYFDPDALQPSEASQPGKQGFRPAVLLAAIHYGKLWGEWLPDAMGQQFAPTGEIIVPSRDIVNFSRYLTMVPNSYANAMQEEILEKGYTDWTGFGRNWTFIADPTIARGTCYPLFNLKPGIIYVKSEFERELLETDIIQYRERRAHQSAFGAYLISQRRPRAMRIKYNN